MVNISINNISYKTDKSNTILKAASENGIEIPVFCNDKRLIPEASCRICLVEVEGAGKLIPACSAKVSDGMRIFTENERVINARKNILDLILADHDFDCPNCPKNGVCRLQEYCLKYDIKKSSYTRKSKIFDIDTSNNFYSFNPNRCILCRKCVRVCRELQGRDVLTASGRGVFTHIEPPFNTGLGNSRCVSCGNCISVCPVGALVPKRNIPFENDEIKKTRTTCVYCGVGCQMNLLTKGDKVVGTEPLDVVPNNGLLCVKGAFAYNFVNHKDRLKTPLIKKDGIFVESSFDEAITFIAEKLTNIKKIYGRESIAGLTSARCTNEENYLMQKFMRAVIGNNNIDHCARLCHATTVSGLAETVGSGAMTNSISEIEKADTIFVIGSNTTETHPVIGTYIQKAKRSGKNLIVADPRKIELAEKADIFMQLKVGTNIALLNGMMNVIISENLQNKDFIEERCENYSGLVSVTEIYTPEYTEKITGVPAKDIINAARLYAGSKNSTIIFSMGITQHTTGTENVFSVSNLAMLCGMIGRENTGINPLRGQNNVQGACDMGGLPNVYPGYQNVENNENRRKFEKAWNSSLSDKTGLTASEMIDSAEKNLLKALYIIGENPVVSEPDSSHTEKALKNLDFLIVQDIFMTETAKLADVILPASSFAEKNGTFTNTERRVQYVQKAIEPVRGTMEDWKILLLLMNKMGYRQNFSSTEEIMDEIAALTPQYGGITHKRILERGLGLQWPCPEKNHEGTPYLHKNTFSRGKGKFIPAAHRFPAEVPDNEYPVILTTGRILYQYHTMTMTGKNSGLMKTAGEIYMEIHPELAENLLLKQGETVKVSSRRGSIKVKAKITNKINKNTVFIPFHFAGGANILTNNALDHFAKEPELKACTVKIEKLYLDADCTEAR